MHGFRFSTELRKVLGDSGTIAGVWTRELVEETLSDRCVTRKGPNQPRTQVHEGPKRRTVTSTQTWGRNGTSSMHRNPFNELEKFRQRS